MKNWATPLGLAGFGSRSEADRSRQQSSDWRFVAIALLVFAGYFLGAKIGFALTFRPHPVSVLWPPNSILLAAFLLTPVRIWWLILLAAFPAHLAAQMESGVPLTMILCWFISNSCEALIGAGFTRYLIHRPVRFDRLRNVGIFCLFAAFLGPFLSSFLDAAFVSLNHWGQGNYWEIWRIRFTSNVLAALTVAPLIVTWSAEGIAWLAKISRWRFLEASLLSLGLLAVNTFVFYKLTPGAESTLLYLPLPFLLWAAVRFGSRGATAAICTVGFLAIWSAGHGYGPFSTRSAEENALSIQVFLIVMSVPMLFLASVLEERGKTEAALRGREERINLAAESANLAFWAINFEHNESWMSDKGRAIFNFAPDEPLSRELFLSRVHPEDRLAVDEAIERARASSQTFEFEYRLLRPDGETRWLISRGRYLRNDAGRVNELIGVAIDVTAQVQADLQLRHWREELAHLSRVALMGEMSASLAHELNQPLAGIVSNAAAGQRFIDDGNITLSELRELLADISADGRRASEVVLGIRRMVKKSETIRQQMNLNDVVKKVAQIVNPDALLRGCEVKTSLEPTLSAIEGDPIQLQQALLNLVINACDAMRDAPPENRKVEITTEWNGDCAIRTSVRDYGVGISEETRERLFDPFFTTKPEGLGMGLAIVRSIVESHAGTVAAENVAGGGARFHFTLSANALASK
jgi:two-component system sensor kinase FixL